MTSKIKFKQMIVDSVDLQKGDIVFTEDGTERYVILEVNRTCLHNHIYYKCFYLNLINPENEHDYITWYSHQLSPKKRIMRLVK